MTKDNEQQEINRLLAEMKAKQEGKQEPVCPSCSGGDQIVFPYGAVQAPLAEPLEPPDFWRSRCRQPVASLVCHGPGVGLVTVRWPASAQVPHWNLGRAGGWQCGGPDRHPEIQMQEMPADV